MVTRGTKLGSLRFKPQKYKYVPNIKGTTAAPVTRQCTPKGNLLFWQCAVQHFIAHKSETARPHSQKKNNTGWLRKGVKTTRLC